MNGPFNEEGRASQDALSAAAQLKELASGVLTARRMARIADEFERTQRRTSSELLLRADRFEEVARNSATLAASMAVTTDQITLIAMAGEFAQRAMINRAVARERGAA